MLCVLSLPQSPANAKNTQLRVVCLLLCLVLLLCACTNRRGEAPTEVPRPNPGHTNWIAKQSMLGSAQDMARIVSGSELGWRAPGTSNSVDASLDSADIWLHIQPQTLLTSGGQTVFEELSSSATLGNIQSLGINGLFIAPANESASLWSATRQAGRAWDDTVTHFFADFVGSDEDYAALRGAASSKNLRLGGQLVPAATGRGPDFFLACRAVRDYAGAYVLIEIPRPMWEQLPPSEGEQGYTALSVSQTTLLAKKGLVPESLARDSLGWAQGGGWAVTGEIKGHDGAMRRWVYRYAGSPERPVLSWDDPSAAARRLVSAGIIRQVGMLHQTMVGTQTEAFFGLDVHPDAKAGTSQNLEPGPSALMAISREIRRYGGNAVAREWLPVEQAAMLQQSGADFVMDSVTSPAAEIALLSGDAAQLRDAFDTAARTRLEPSRVCRVVSNNDGLALGSGLVPNTWRSVVPAYNGKMYASAPALAAMRAGFAPDQLKTAASRTETTRLHTLLLALRAGLPGMLWVSGQDIVGTSHPEVPGTSQPDSNILPAWGLGSTPPAATRQGLGRGFAVYGSVAAQESLGDSFAAKLKRFAAIRDKLGVAKGRSVTRLPSQGKGSVVLLTSLPGGGSLITAVNFGNDYASERIVLPSGAKRNLTDVWTQSPINVDGNAFNMALPALSFRLIHMPGR